METPKVAFVLAAGRGERLRPLTDKTPKPLLPIQGKPILAHILDRLEKLELQKVVLNAWHLADQVESFASSIASHYSFEILVSREDILLGTGGGLKKALPLIGETPFLMMNGDCFWDGDLNAFIQKASETTGVESLWLLTKPHPQQTVLEYAHDRLLSIGSLWRDLSASNIPADQLQRGCFSGIQVIKDIEPKLLPDEGCLIRQYYLSRLSAGGAIGAVSGYLKSWEDVGTPERYKALSG